MRKSFWLFACGGGVVAAASAGKRGFRTTKIGRTGLTVTTRRARRR